MVSDVISKPVKGYTCPVCEKFHAFSPYVFAHRYDELVHECKECLTKSNLYNYEVISYLLPSGGEEVKVLRGEALYEIPD